MPTIEQTLAWLRDLPALWHAAEPSGRRLLAEAVFERIDVLGIGIAEITPTPEADAHGWSDAFGEPVVLSVNLKTGRGERSQACGTDLFVPVAWTLPRVLNAPRKIAGARLGLHTDDDTLPDAEVRQHGPQGR